MSSNRPAKVAVALMREAVSGVTSNGDQHKVVSLSSQWAKARDQHSVTWVKVVHNGVELFRADGQLVDKQHLDEMPQDPVSMKELRTAAITLLSGNAVSIERKLGLEPGSIICTKSSIGQLFSATETLARLFTIVRSPLR